MILARVLGGLLLSALLSVLPAALVAQTVAVDSGCERGRVTGVVFSQRDSTPAAGAVVVARWAAVAPLLRTAEARADARGRFTLCGLPVDTPVFVRAADGDRESDATELSLRMGAAPPSIGLALESILPDTAKANRRSDDVTARQPLATSDARTVSLERYNAATGRGSVIGIVTSKEGGVAVPYADLLVEPFSVAAFTGAQGSFRLTQVPAGPLRLRVRRIGFLPASATVTVRADATDTLRIELPSVALRLSQVRVTDAVCPNRAARAVDSSIVTILQQVQLNAYRVRLLSTEHPFEMLLQRTIANEGLDPYTTVRRVIVDTVTVDTITATVDHGWRYEPGALIRKGEPTGNRRLGAPERMVVPQLIDFAEPAFVASHCFRFAGVVALDGRKMIRVDLEPTKDVRTPDVRGSLYFDTLSYQVQRSTLFVDRPSPLQAGDFWLTRVDTWFKEIAPSLPVIERVTQRTTLRTVQKADAWPGQAATEEQRLLGMRFIGQRVP
jgi:hypothetical protein